MGNRRDAWLLLSREEDLLRSRDYGKLAYSKMGNGRDAWQSDIPNFWLPSEDSVRSRDYGKLAFSKMSNGRDAWRLTGDWGVFSLGLLLLGIFGLSQAYKFTNCLTKSNILNLWSVPSDLSRKEDLVRSRDYGKLANKPCE
eukprot:scaffold11257_cov513-Chaetoceros_neogracile.AAC.2